MTTYLGKSCSFGLPRVPFVNCRQFIYLGISLLVLRAGCGIWLYQFLIIAYLFTFNLVPTLSSYVEHRLRYDSLSMYTLIFKQVAQRATIAHLSPMCQGQISFKKIQTHPNFNACSCYMEVSKGSNQKQQRKSRNTIFPIIRSIGVFLRRSRAANSVVGGPIWPKFELILNIMHVLVTCKFEKDRININGDYVMTSIF